MWVATNFGFFSAVRRPADTIAETDECELQVRARALKHLVLLRNYLGDDERPIQRWAHSDYEFRMYVTYTEWVQLLARITYDIDYDNFKSSVRDDRLHDAYLRIWAVIASAFDHRSRKPRGRGSSRR